jgi:hypothetical protein
MSQNGGEEKVPAEQTPFALTPEQIATLAQITANGTANYHLGYQYIVNLHHLGQLNLDAGTLYWFQQAREINANDPSSPANAFIREHTAIGLEKVGRTADLQAISDKIGELVINDLLTGRQMTLDRMWQTDITAATGEFGLPVAGWGGAFYYWDQMCEKDGGVEIFDKVSVTRSQLDALGKVGGYVSIPPEALANPDSPVFSTRQTEVIKQGHPSLHKWVETVVRRSDNRVVARVTSYTRSGGDFPSHAAPSSFTCPPAIERFAHREKIFVLQGD